MTATVPPLAQLPAGSVLSEEAATSAETEADAEALLVTTVDIGDGKAGKIELRAGDDPMVPPARSPTAVGNTLFSKSNSRILE